MKPSRRRVQRLCLGGAEYLNAFTHGRTLERDGIQFSKRTGVKRHSKKSADMVLNLPSGYSSLSPCLPLPSLPPRFPNQFLMSSGLDSIIQLGHDL